MSVPRRRPDIAITGFHPLDGALYFRDVGGVDSLLCQLVAYHSCAVVEAEERGVREALEPVASGEQHGDRGVASRLPQVVLPQFWDQHDNAQRLDELGVGVRLDPFRFVDAELHEALERMLGDRALTDRLVADLGRGLGTGLASLALPMHYPRGWMTARLSQGNE